MNATSLAHAYGAAAFNEGRSKAPRSDSAYCALAATLSSDDTLPAASAFLKGWEDAANAAFFRQRNRTAAA